MKLTNTRRALLLVIAVASGAVTLSHAWKPGLSLLTGASTAACPAHFADGQPPALLNPKLAAQTSPLFFRAFAVLHSGVTRTPLWSAEHLTSSSLAGAGQMPRLNAFHAAALLARGLRAELSDYVGSGYDRGHMIPSGDMPDAQAQQESFSLVNVVPRAPRLNRGLWEGVEAALRGVVRQGGDLFVVTGPVFAGAELQALQNRVLIPSSLWKALYDPAAATAGAYNAANADDGTIRSIRRHSIEVSCRQRDG